MADLQWEQFTLGQNETIAKIAAAAAKAATLVDANAKFAQSTLKAGQVLLMGLLNPQLLILVAIADEIDNVISDFKGTGFYVLEVVPHKCDVIPKDAAGNAIALAVSPVALTAAYAASAAKGFGQEWLNWFEIVSGEQVPPVKRGEKIKLQKSSYYIEQGKSKAEAVRTQNANDNTPTEKDKTFGFPKMTPSGIIAQIIAAMDEEADINRPTFSASAEVAAIVVIIGFADISKNILPLSNALQAFIAFFGGSNGLMNKGIFAANAIIIHGMKKALGVDNKGNPVVNPVDTVTIKVTNVSGVRGTDDDKEILNHMGISYNYEAGFEVGNLVVGPIRMFGGTAGKGRAMGIVSKVTTTPDTPRAPYSSQELELVTLTPTDKHAFEHLSNGNKIQKVAYYKNQESHIDQNSGELIEGDYFNDYKYIQDLPIEKELEDIYVEDSVGVVSEGGIITTQSIQRHVGLKQTDESKQIFAEEAAMEVEKLPGKALLKVTKKKSVVEKHTFTPHTKRTSFGGEVATGSVYTEKNWWGGYDTEKIPKDYKTKNEVVGEIFALKVTAPAGVHPNFKKAKLEDLMGDLQTFFFQIEQFTDGLRAFAEGAGKAIENVIKYLDEKIKEIEELNKTIQDILALFTIGIPDAGVYVLSIPTTVGGNEAIKTALQSASNRPPNTLEMSVGFMMMGGGPSMEVLQKLLGVKSVGSAAIAEGTA